MTPIPPEEFRGVFKDPASAPAHGQSHSGVGTPNPLGQLGRHQFQIEELYKQIRGANNRPAGGEAFQITASLPGLLEALKSASGQTHRDATMTHIYYYLQDVGSGDCHVQLYVDGDFYLEHDLGVNFYDEAVNIPFQQGATSFYWLVTYAGVGVEGLTITAAFQ